MRIAATRIGSDAELNVRSARRWMGDIQDPRTVEAGEIPLWIPLDIAGASSDVHAAAIHQHRADGAETNDVRIPGSRSTGRRIHGTDQVAWGSADERDVDPARIDGARSRRDRGHRIVRVRIPGGGGIRREIEGRDAVARRSSDA